MSNQPGSIFLDVALPNATTWFFFSILLTIAIYFKFSRLFSIRNLDIVTIFLLVPGLLLLQEAHRRPPEQAPLPYIATTAFLVSSSANPSGIGAIGAATVIDELPTPRAGNLKDFMIRMSYLWLLIGSCYFLFRCFLDLILERRPALPPNLSMGGLFWLATALFICLTVVAFRPSYDEPHPSAPAQSMVPNNTEPIGQPTAPVQLAQTTFRTYTILSKVFSIVCHLSIFVGLLVMGAWHFQDVTSGIAMATIYLLVPYTGYFFGQIHHVWPMSLMIWAVVCYRKPSFAGCFLGLAAGTSFFPFLLLPVWLSFYWGRGSTRFLISFAVFSSICLGVTATILWNTNDLMPIISETLALPDWQPWQWKIPTHEGFWTGIYFPFRMPVFILYLAMLCVIGFWPSQKNLGHLIALSTAVFLGLQLWFADRGGVYILWYLPFYILMVFRPNLMERRPPEIRPTSSWFSSLRKVVAEKRLSENGVNKAIRSF